MKTQKEIEQLAEKMFDCIDKPTRSGKDKHSYLVGVQEGYTQSQEDMVKEIDNLKGQLREFQSKEPKYAIKGDYCAVCGCTEFWNDDEEE